MTGTYRPVFVTVGNYFFKRKFCLLFITFGKRGDDFCIEQIGISGKNIVLCKIGQPPRIMAWRFLYF